MLIRQAVKKAGGAKSNLLPLYLKERSTGTVHSKFKNGFNVQFEQVLLYVGRVGTPLSAFGLQPAEDTLRILLDCLEVGDWVVNKENTLLFYSRSGVVLVPYQGFEERDVRLPHIKCSRRELAHRRLYRELEGLAFERHIGICLDEKTRHFVEQLVVSDKQDLQGNSRLVAFFTGRGKGLTPSGDDLLLGFTLAQSSFGEVAVWRQAMAEGITSDKTTLISVSYVTALLAGYVSEQYRALVTLLDTDDATEMEIVLKEVQSVGHTSGYDTLFGFFLGLKSFVRP